MGGDPGRDATGGVGARPPVSVVVPTHGRPALLAQALRSIRAQSDPPLEVIVVDDLGCDRTAEVVLDVSQHWSVPTRYVARSGVAGASASRNLGTDLAASEWVAYLDDDDLWFSDHLSTCWRVASGSPADLVSTMRLHFTEGSGAITSVVCPTIPASAFERFALSTHIGGSNLYIRRELARAVRWDERLPAAQDADFVVRCLDAGSEVRVAENPTVAVRAHDAPRVRSESGSQGWRAFHRKHGGSVPVAARLVVATRPRGTDPSRRRRRLQARVGWAAGYLVALLEPGARARDVRRAIRSVRGATRAPGPWVTERQRTELAALLGGPGSTAR